MLVDEGAGELDLITLADARWHGPAGWRRRGRAPYLAQVSAR